ncbi:hypothetical protein FV242_09420 [Methylobacterium sp. WL64]|uniref:hypothetical protein n=1 Tax=Methylobacterium sp. WL64 TaxID=2603894 RepID=UPI0011CC0D3B|nr:hypothetical protein [Methylobacterium sp. WL64]TXN03930.1 hypothetical protein FV242_09420 [Methylobacterium sp. WL64]
MKSVAHSLIAALAAFAVLSPSIVAAVPAGRSAEQPRPAVDRSALIAERQQRTWQQLSGSICTGCITVANRVAPVSYDKPSLVELAQRPTRLATAARRPRAKVRLAQLRRAKMRVAQIRLAQMRKRYARLHRHDRRRLAAGAHPVRLAKRPPPRTLALAGGLPVGPIQVEYRLPEHPVERPWVPQDDNRWHATILPASSVRPRRS